MSKKQNNPNLKFDGTEHLTYSGEGFRGFPEDDEVKVKQQADDMAAAVQKGIDDYNELRRGHQGPPGPGLTEEEVAPCEPASYTVTIDYTEYRPNYYDPTIPWENTAEAMNSRFKQSISNEVDYLVSQNER